MHRLLHAGRPTGQHLGAKFVQSSMGRMHMSLIGTPLESAGRTLQHSAVWHWLVNEEDQPISMIQLLDSRPGAVDQVRRETQLPAPCAVA